jgi:hypothetical protein
MTRRKHEIVGLKNERGFPHLAAQPTDILTLLKSVRDPAGVVKTSRNS